jgi:hypothetical protein
MIHMLACPEENPCPQIAFPDYMWRQVASQVYVMQYRKPIVNQY